jgi:hypothetical protein
LRLDQAFGVRFSRYQRSTEPRLRQHRSFSRRKNSNNVLQDRPVNRSAQGLLVSFPTYGAVFSENITGNGARSEVRAVPDNVVRVRVASLASTFKTARGEVLLVKQFARTSKNFTRALFLIDHPPITSKNSYHGLLLSFWWPFCLLSLSPSLLHHQIAWSQLSFLLRRIFRLPPLSWWPLQLRPLLLRFRGNEKAPENAHASSHVMF